MRLVEFPLDGGGSVVVEVDDPATAVGAVTRGLGDSRVTERAQQSFENAIGRVQPAVQAMLTRLRDLTDTPDEVQVEFSVQLSAEAGAFVASARTTGNFRVSMTWRRIQASTGKPSGDPDEVG